MINFTETQWVFMCISVPFQMQTLSVHPVTFLWQVKYALAPYDNEG